MLFPLSAGSRALVCWTLCPPRWPPGWLSTCPEQAKGPWSSKTDLCRGAEGWGECVTRRQGSLSVCNDEEGYGGPRTEQARSANWSPSGHPRLQSAQEHHLLLRPVGTFPETNRGDPGLCHLICCGYGTENSCIRTNLRTKNVAARSEGLPRWLGGKEPACQCRRHKRPGLDPWVGRSPGGGHGNPLQYSCLGSGQRSLAGYSPWGHKELDTTEHTSFMSKQRTLRPSTLGPSSRPECALERSQDGEKQDPGPR